MRRSLRYALSLVVGGAMTGVTLALTPRDSGYILAIPVTYMVVTAMLLDNLRTVRLGIGEHSSSKIGAIGGGIGAGGTVTLAHQSIAAGITGYGLFMLGIARVTAEFDGRFDPK
jgi:hypothetical protein